MSWDGETNPHFFWTRDRPKPPGDQPGPSRQQPGPSGQQPGPSRQQPGPSGQQPGPSRQQPGRKTRARRDRPDGVRLPPPIQPVVSQPTPRTQRPEYAGHGPEIVLPTSQDNWPMHPTGASEERWPIDPHHSGHEGPPHPRTQQPHFEPTTGHPHPKRQQHPDHDLRPHPPKQTQLGMTTGPPHPAKQQQPDPDHDHDHDHDGMTTGRPHPTKQQQPDYDHGLPSPRKQQQQPHADAGAPPPRRQGRQRREDTLIYPSPHRTNAFTWFIAIFCVVLWVAIILGGILILIIYLAYRPRNPHFEISDASLNAAYLDMGYLLNADLTLLVNFTNMNQKMSVDFNFIVLKLRYENHMIANQYIEPFSAGRLEKRFARVEMVSSQIRLPVIVTQQLIRQIQSNRISFEIDGYFHARSRLGTIFRYSYWLYSHCTLVTKGPPSGVMVVSKCITKR